MNNFGHLIKLERNRRNIKQINLARGICSTSYLSKIENNITIPSEEVKNLLLKKLNINEVVPKEDDFEDYMREVQGYFQDAVINKDSNHAKIYLEKINNTSLLVNNNFFFTDLLIKWRLSLISSNLSLSAFYLNETSEMNSNFNDYQMFLFNVNKGIHLYNSKKFLASLESLEKAHKILSGIAVSEWEKADFYYLISLNYLMNNQVLNALELSHKALKYYKDNFLSVRSLDCYIIQGIAFKRFNRLDKALEIFNLANKIISELDLKEFEGIVNQNLGSTYSKSLNHKEAIFYYEKSFNQKSIPSEQLLPIFSIIKEYSKLNYKKEVNHWIRKGKSILQVTGSKDFLDYDYHFDFYYLIHNEENIEDHAPEIIQFFLDREDYRHVYKYCIALGSYYLNAKKYRLSALYYDKAIKYEFRNTKITKWEDL